MSQDELELPQDLDGERALLASLAAPGMEVHAAEILPTLRAEDFMHPTHREIFLALKAVSAAGMEITLHAIRENLAARKSLDLVGGFIGLTEVLAEHEVGRPEQLAKYLRSRRQLRDVMKIAHTMLVDASGESKKASELARAGAMRLLEAVEDDDHSTEAVSVSDALTGLLEPLMSGQRCASRGIKSGLHTLDRITGGFHPGQLIILAARPRMGKSAMALNWAEKSAESRMKTLVASMEMGQEELVDRLVATRSSLQSGWSKWENLTDGQIAEAMRVRDSVLQLPLFANDQAVLSPAMIRAQLAKAKAKGSPYSMLVVDYLQLMSNDDDALASRQNEATRVGVLSRAMKILAKEFQIPVVVLSQMSRDQEKSSDRAPRLSDLRDSGAIEQDADMVLFIYRKMVDGFPSDHGELLLAKHRGGACASIPIAFNGAKMVFEEARHETQPSHSW